MACVSQELSAGVSDRAVAQRTGPQFGHHHGRHHERLCLPSTTACVPQMSVDDCAVARVCQSLSGRQRHWASPHLVKCWVWGGASVRVRHACTCVARILPAATIIKHELSRGCASGAPTLCGARVCFVGHLRPNSSAPAEAHIPLHLGGTSPSYFFTHRFLHVL